MGRAQKKKRFSWIFANIPWDVLASRVRFFWEFRHFGGFCPLYMLDAAKNPRILKGFHGFEKFP